MHLLSGMSTKKKTTRKKSTKEELPIWPHQVQGGKYVKILQRFMKKLRNEDTENSNSNQKLFLDDVIIAYLLTFFNASIKSLRTIEDFSQTKQGQKHLSIRKICKSTLSDFNALADPERLKPLIHALREGLDKTPFKGNKKDRDLSSLVAQAVAVDGTFIPALSEVLWAVQNRNQHGSQKHRARIDVMLQVETWIPEAIVVPEPKQGEANSARQQIQPGKIYLFDRGYNSLKLIADHYDLKDVALPKVQAEFVIRLKKDAEGQKKSSIGLTMIEGRTLTDEDREAGVVSDRIVKLNSENSKKLGLQNVTLREVIIEYEEDGEIKTMSLLTNLLDVSAAVIGQLYRYRWQVELFFRWMKSYSNFRHLISQTKEGMQLNLYVAIIGIMLMYLQTGFRPSKYMFAMMSMVATGGATLEDIMPILRERERRCALDRESQRKRNAKKRAEKMNQQTM